MYYASSEYRYWFDKHYGLGIIYHFNHEESTGDGFFLDGQIHTVSLFDGTSLLDYHARNGSLMHLIDMRNAPITWSKTSADSIRLFPLTKGKTITIGAEVTVKGATQIVEIESDSFLSCTCTTAKKRYSYYQSDCLHKFLVVKYLDAEVKKLAHDYLASPLKALDKGLFIDFALDDKLHQFPQTHGNGIKEIQEAQEIVEMVKMPQSDAYIKAVLWELLNITPSYYRSNFLMDYLVPLVAMLDDQKIKNIILSDEMTRRIDSSSGWGNQYRSNRSLFRKIVKAYEKACKEIEEKQAYSDLSSERVKEVLLMVRGDLKGMLRLCNDKTYFIDLPDTDMLSYVLKTVELDEETMPLMEKLLKKVDEADLPSTDKRNLFFAGADRLSGPRQRALFMKLSSIKLDFSAIKDLDHDDQLSLIHHVVPTEQTLSTIMDTILADSDDKTKGRYLLETVNSIPRYSEYDPLRNRFASYAENLKDGRILAYFLQQFSDDIKEDQQELPATSLEAEIDTYFNTEFFFDQSADVLTCFFLAVNPYAEKQHALVLMEQEDTYTFQDLDKRLYGHIDPHEFKRICLKGRESSYEEAKEKEIERIAREHFTKDHKLFAGDLNELTSSLDKDQTILFSEVEKASLHYDFVYENGDVAVAFSVGNTRMYLVKNAVEFISNFKKRVTVTYGKDLILTHAEENIVPSDAKVIQLLSATRLTFGKPGDPKQKKYLKLSAPLFSSVIEHLQGRKVTFNGSPTLVRLAPQTFRAGIDKNFKLTTTFGENQLLMVMGNKGYVFSRLGVESTIDKAAHSINEIKILAFFQTHPEVSIKPIVADFKRRIYANYPGLIDIAPEAKASFKLSELAINAYFDYASHAITIETKLEKDGKRVDTSHLENLDKEKISSFSSYLATLGFDEKGVMANDANVLSFFRMDFSKLRSLCTVYLSESLSNKKIVSMSRQVFRITYDSGIMNLFLEKSDFSQSELEEILKGLKLKKHFVILKGDRIVDLENQEAKDFEETATDFGMEGKDLFTKRQIGMATAIKAFAHQRNCRTDTYLRNMIDDLRNFKDADISLPTLHAKLRTYQIEGFNWLTILKTYHLGGFLADDMGLGKTLQIIATLKADTLKQPSLVICPKSLVFNWENEISKFDGKTDVVEIYGSEPIRTNLIKAINYKKKTIYITSYDSFRIDCQKYSGQFAFAILDEAQYIKNVYAQKTKSVKTIDALYRFAMTGTPIENSIIDLWSIFDFVMPGYLDELSVFKQAEHDSIRRKVSPFILRRTKSDVLTDLPAKYERTLTAEMGSEQRKLYEAVRQEATEVLKAGGKAFDILPYLMRLRQICIDPRMYLEGSQYGSTKMDALEHLIPEYLQNGHRILIFSQFVKALYTLQDILTRKQIPCFLLTGDTPAKERISLMNSFNEGEGTDVFLISLKAGGTGLNLTGADTVIHLDPWWNLAAEDQADDRTHRIGQNRNVEVIKLIAEDSIEQRVIELQNKKKDIIDKVISHDDSSIVNATLEDIAFILK